MPETTKTRVRFTVYQPGLAPQQVTLAGEGLISLGRASECTIPIRDRFLSRRHAEVREAWSSTCPLNCAWEDALADDLVRFDDAGRLVLTEHGRTRLATAAPPALSTA